MSAFFIRRPIVAMVIAILIVIGGAVSLQRMSIEQYPPIAPPQVTVNADYAGANAEVVEESVATPLEQALNGTDNLTSMRSENSNDGSMEIALTFAVGANLDTSNVLAQNRVSQALAQLPQSVIDDGVVVRKQNPSILMVVSLYSPNGTYDALFLNNYNALNVRDAILRVPGVSQVNLFGGSEYGMRVWLKPDLLARLNLTPSDVIAVIREQNLRAPGGTIGAAPSPPGQQFTYSVRTPSSLTTPEEFNRIIVRTSADGRQVRLEDVARVEFGADSYSSTGRLNGKPAGVMSVYLMPGANQLQTADGIYRALRELKQYFPADVDYDIVYDTTPSVRASLEEITRTLFEAVILVVIVVFLFLQNFRATFIPVLTVPVSLMGVLLLLPVFGFSVNTLTMFGMVLAIGIVVDDAIVVVEAVTQHIERGLEPKVAALTAMEEVAGPVVGVGLVLTAVFVPVAFIGGVTGRLYQPFALTIAIAVLLSVFSALSLTPALAALILRPSKPMRGPMGLFFRGFNKAFDLTTHGYVGFSGMLARKSFLSLLILVLVAFLSWRLSEAVPSSFIPFEDQGLVLTRVRLPRGASAERTDAVIKMVEAIVAKTPGVNAYNAVRTGPSTALFFARLKPWDERTTSAESLRGIIRHLRSESRAIPEAQVSHFVPPPIPGFGSDSEISFVLQDRSGTLTVDELSAQAQRFVGAASQRPELSDVSTSFDSLTPQYAVAVDRDEAEKLGVRINDVFTTLNTSLGGSRASDFNRFGRLYRVRVQAEAEARQNPEDIGRLYVRSATTGKMIPLSTLVTVTPTTGPDSTVRFNLYRSAEVSASPADGYSSAQAMAALEDVARQMLPPQMSYTYEALSLEEKNAPSPVPTFVLAVVIVFLLLAAVYESWSLPWAVLLGTPIVVMGAYLGIWLVGIESNVYVQIGMVMLIGLAAKNAILIVEFAKVEREKGRSAVDAALAAARLRFRPIVMTALAFILGVVPLVRATGSGAAARATMGIAVFSGMTVATVVGLVIYPALFVVIEWLSGRRSPAGTSAGSPVSGAIPVDGGGD